MVKQLAHNYGIQIVQVAVAALISFGAFVAYGTIQSEASGLTIHDERRIVQELRNYVDTRVDDQGNQSHSHIRSIVARLDRMEDTQQKILFELRKQ